MRTPEQPSEQAFLFDLQEAVLRCWDEARILGLTAKSVPNPVVIKGKQGNAVLISEEDWNAVSETLYLASIP